MNARQTVKEKMLTEPNYDKSGFVNYRYNNEDYKLWYGRVGAGHKPPVLILHGGPGSNHHNLVAFQALADERPVIFYDQLGCGKSDCPDNPALWTAERYFDEPRAVRDGLNLDKYHLIGHSWGTTLAVGFAAQYPDGILSISLHSPVLSFPRYREEVAPNIKDKLKSFGGRGGEIIDDYELKGQGKKEDYEEVCHELARKYVVLARPLPDSMKKMLSRRNKQIHDVMVGSDSELNIPGNLRKVDVTGELSSLNVPILVTCGSNDFCLPDYCRWQTGFAKHAKFYIISHSAHMTPVDNPEELMKIQSVFLDKAETGGNELKKEKI